MSDVYVLDASAVLCLLFDEPGAPAVEARLAGARLSAVNYHEVIAKLVDRGVPADEVITDLGALDVEIVTVDQHQAETGGLMRAETRKLGLSLGDRACLALARQLGGIAVTADRVWREVDVGVRVEVVR